MLKIMCKTIIFVFFTDHHFSEFSMHLDVLYAVRSNAKTLG